MDSRLQQRVEEGRDVVRRSAALDTTRPYDIERDGLRRALDNLITAVETSPTHGHLRVGDLLEWIAGGLAGIGAYFAATTDWPLAAVLAVVAVFLAYQAQCYAARPLRLRKRPQGRDQ